MTYLMTEKIRPKLNFRGIGQTRKVFEREHILSRPEEMAEERDTGKDPLEGRYRVMGKCGTTDEKRLRGGQVYYRQTGNGNIWR